MRTKQYYSLLQIFCFCVLTAFTNQNAKAQSGTFESNIESLQQNYETPEWFRDAKFGIYIHWGVYSVPEQGEWYARNMYQENRKEYAYHVEHYGHPSKFGYKDLVPLWKADKFDPDAMVKLFKEAGAKYFTPCAVHHDNFDLWNSSEIHKWNSVKMGPKKDIIGMFKEATLKHGLRFGVTTHLERTSSWYQTNKQADTQGKYKGKPYDGHKKKYQDFYLAPNEDGDNNAAHPKNAPEYWRKHWAERMKLLIDKYQPDHLYVDGGVPFYGDDEGKTGLDVISYYYNQNAKVHGGKNEGVMCIKDWRAHRNGTIGHQWGYYWEGVATLDIENKKSDTKRNAPWQTDDSIGPWGYKKGAEYKTADEVIDKLVDIVSKNGNLLLNVPPKADGTLDNETVELLKAIGVWLKANGEAIYGTRPWIIAQENDVRYTMKNGNLYAIDLKPRINNEFTISRLAAVAGVSKVKSVEVLSSSLKVDWKQSENGLHIKLPKTLPNQEAVSLKISFE